MKDLSIEEKAKAYDLALDRAKKLIVTSVAYDKFTIEKIFPELRESGDEEVRKEIMQLIRGMYEADPRKERWLAWLEKQGQTFTKKEVDDAYLAGVRDTKQELEKQGEPKEINLVEILKHHPKETELYSPLYGKLWLAEVDEKNGIITCYKHHLEEGCTRAVLGQEDIVSFYSNGTTGLPDFEVSKDCMLFLYDVEKQGEQNLIMAKSPQLGEQKPTDNVELKYKVGEWVVSPNGVYWHIDAIRDGRYHVTSNSGECAEWPLDADIYHNFSIQDAKDGDVLADNLGVILFKSIRDNNVINYYAYLSGLFSIQKGEQYWGYAINCTLSPATKEQRERFFAKMHEAGWEFDFEKKELKKIEPFDKYEGLTDFERTLADICIGWIGEELGWKDYIIKNSLPLLELAKKQFDEYEQKPTDYDKELKKCLENPLYFFDKYVKLKLKKSAKWSEEDELKRTTLIHVVKKQRGSAIFQGLLPEELTNWLESLKQRIGG